MAVIDLKIKKKVGVAPADTWTVRGVPPESRTKALVASRKAGQTMGEWVARAIDEHAKTAAGTPAPTNDAALAAILAQLEKRDQAMADLAGKLEEIEKRRSWFIKVFGG
jgi:hypothetical protein